MRKSVLKDKSYAFAIEIVMLSQKLQKDSKEYVLSKQILLSGTAIGALILEAEFGQSKLYTQAYHFTERSQRNKLLAKPFEGYGIS